jgi:hypothetical protein
VIYFAYRLPVPVPLDSVAMTMEFPTPVLIQNISELVDTFFIVIHKKPLIFLHWYHHITGEFCMEQRMPRRTVKASGVPFVLTIVRFHCIFSVLLYCWHSYVTTSPPGIFFVVMNYSVHATMYGYYFLMAMRWRPKWFNPVWVTIAQISQMVVGVAVTLIGFYYYQTDSTCNIQKQNNIAAFIMYGSYLFLFLQFFIGRYYKGQVKVVPKKKTV